MIKQDILIKEIGEGIVIFIATVCITMILFALVGMYVYADQPQTRTFNIFYPYGSVQVRVKTNSGNEMLASNLYEEIDTLLYPPEELQDLHYYNLEFNEGGTNIEILSIPDYVEEEILVNHLKRCIQDIQGTIQ